MNNEYANTLSQCDLDQAERDASLNDYPIDAVFGKKLKRPDDYNDVRQQVIEDYQAYLEQTWVASLRKRYPVEINQEVLKTVNKH